MKKMTRALLLQLTQLSHACNGRPMAIRATYALYNANKRVKRNWLARSNKGAELSAT